MAKAEKAARVFEERLVLGTCPVCHEDLAAVVTVEVVILGVRLNREVSESEYKNGHVEAQAEVLTKPRSLVVAHRCAPTTGVDDETGPSEG